MTHKNDQAQEFPPGHQFALQSPRLRLVLVLLLLLFINFASTWTTRHRCVSLASDTLDQYLLLFKIAALQEATLRHLWNFTKSQLFSILRRDY